MATTNEGPQIPNKKVTVGKVTADSIQISWSKATDKETAQSKLKYSVTWCKPPYTWDERRKSSGRMVDISSYTITGLEANSDYEIIIYVSDEAGCENTYSRETVKTAPAAETAAPPKPAATKESEPTAVIPEAAAEATGTVTVGTPTGIPLKAGGGGWISYKIVTADIAVGKECSITWYTTPEGTVAASAPEKILLLLSTASADLMAGKGIWDMTDGKPVTLDVMDSSMDLSVLVNNDIKEGGTYYFKVTIGGVASNVATITVAPADAFVFTDNSYFDIPLTAVGAKILKNVREAIKGGIPPYKYGATGLPAGIAIDQSGLISGVPTAVSPAGKATITVTDNSPVPQSRSITINYGAIEATRTFTVGKQQGALKAKKVGEITFPVKTTGIPDGKYTANYFQGNEERPAGIRLENQYWCDLVIKDGKGTLTFEGTTSTVEGSYKQTLTLKDDYRNSDFDTLKSSEFTITIGKDDRSITVGKQQGIVYASTTNLPDGVDNMVTFPITTTDFPDGTSLAMRNYPGGIVRGGARVRTENNKATMKVGFPEVAAGTYTTMYVEGYIDGVVITSNKFTLTVTPSPTVKVGAQSGELYVRDAAGSVTFPLTTTNIPDGTYEVEISPHSCYTIPDSITIKSGKGTLTVRGTASTFVGTDRLKIKLFGATSNEFTLTVSVNEENRIADIRSGLSQGSYDPKTLLLSDYYSETQKDKPARSIKNSTGLYVATIVSKPINNEQIYIIGEGYNNVIYPGAILFADRDLAEGKPGALTNVKRAPIDLYGNYFSGESTSKRGIIATSDYVHDAVNEIVKGHFGQKEEWEAPQTGQIQTSYYSSRKSMALEFGSDLDFAGNKIHLDFTSSSEEQSIIESFNCKQKFLTVSLGSAWEQAFDTLFDNTETWENILLRSGGKPLCIVTSVIYGRDLHFVKEFKSKSWSMVANQKVDAWGQSITSKQDIAESSIAENSGLIAIGASGDILKAALNTTSARADIEQALKDNMKFSRTNQGNVIGYTLILLSGIYAGRAIAPIYNGYVWTTEYKRCPNTVQVNVRCNAWTLAGEKNVKVRLDATVITYNNKGYIEKRASRMLMEERYDGEVSTYKTTQIRLGANEYIEGYMRLSIRGKAGSIFDWWQGVDCNIDPSSGQIKLKINGTTRAGAGRLYIASDSETQPVIV